jgi:hypothetical protein
METPQFTSEEIPPKKNQTLLIVAVVVILLCCCCVFLAAAGYFSFVTIRSTETQAQPFGEATPDFEFAPAEEYEVPDPPIARRPRAASGTISSAMIRGTILALWRWGWGATSRSGRPQPSKYCRNRTAESGLRNGRWPAHQETPIPSRSNSSSTTQAPHSTLSPCHRIPKRMPGSEPAFFFMKS